MASPGWLASRSDLAFAHSVIRGSGCRRLVRFALALGVLVAASCRHTELRKISLDEVRAESGWVLVPDVPFFGPASPDECGVAALAMVLRFWGVGLTPDVILDAYQPSGGRPFAAAELRDVARAQGLEAWVVRGDAGDLAAEVERGHPVIVRLSRQRAGNAHYEVVIGVNPSRQEILTLDPEVGLRRGSIEAFARDWATAERLTIVFARPEVEPTFTAGK